MKPSTIHIICGGAALLLLGILVSSWSASANSRLHASLIEQKNRESKVVVASAADEGFCTQDLKQILRRVLTSCGLVKKDQGRGCQPLEAKTVAAMSGGDFNALFKPLASRAAIIQFEKDKAELDDVGKALLEKTFADQRGASYFLVVSRASPEGSVAHNRELSEKRANAALEYLKERFKDPDLDQEVGLLWLGEEFAQLDQGFCQWARSWPDAQCSTAELNRSAFLAWIDCRL